MLPLRKMLVPPAPVGQGPCVTTPGQLGGPQPPLGLVIDRPGRFYGVTVTVPRIDEWMAQW